MKKMILNPDKEERRRVAMAVKENDGYCPCLLERNEDTKCPCKAKREQGICICGLYVEVEEDHKEAEDYEYVVYGRKNCAMQDLQTEIATKRNQV